MSRLIEDGGDCRCVIITALCGCRSEASSQVMLLAKDIIYNGEDDERSINKR
jgi:hypothetical protein